jgi:hypothetical protein
MVYTFGACAVLLIESRPPPVHNTSVSSSQVYASPLQPAPPPSRRSTRPNAPTHEHASSFSRQLATPPSRSISHYQPFPAGYASINSSPSPPMTQRAATMPMPVHQNIASSMSHDMLPHPPSRSEMSGWPQASSQSWSYRAYAAYISLGSFLWE